MITIDIKGDLDKLITQVGLLGSKQLPYIASLTLNALAEESKAEVIRQMPSRFTIRKPWITKGLRITYSRAPHRLLAVVSDIDLFMNKQETGGDQVNINGKRFLAVPMPDARNGRTGSVMVKYQLKNLPRIGAALHGPRSKATQLNAPFYLDAHDGNHYIAIREGGGAGSAKGRSGVKLLYVLKPVTHYKERFDFSPTVAKVVVQHTAAKFNLALAEALRTAK